VLTYYIRIEEIWNAPQKQQQQDVLTINTVLFIWNKAR